MDRDFWTYYLGDILTFSVESWAHFGHLAQVVRAHTSAGIKIQPCKTKLFQSEVEYLGHKISKGGVSMIPEYVQKIKDWPVPKSGKDILRICRILPHFHPSVLCDDEQTEQNKKG